MSVWNHVICEACWNRKNPGRPPVKLYVSGGHYETCCYCSAATCAGIHVRENPADMPCNGVHSEEASEEETAR
jgi:hypothetical protein